MTQLTQSDDTEAILSNTTGAKTRLDTLASSSSNLNWFQMLIATVAALNHVNERNGMVLPFLQSTRCRYNLSYSILDTSTQYYEAVSAFAGVAQKLDLDFLVGGTNDDVNIPISIISGAYNVPMISPWSFLPELNDVTIHPYFARISPSIENMAQALVAYLHHMGYAFASVLYIEGQTGSIIKDSLIQSSHIHGISLFPIPINSDSFEHINATMNDLARSKRNIIVAAIPLRFLADTMSIAASNGLVGRNRLWVLTDMYEPHEIARIANQNTKFAELLNGTMRVVFQRTNEKDINFLRLKSAWKSFAKYEDQINAALAEFPRINANSKMDSEPTLYLPPDIFRPNLRLARRTAFAYDAAVSAALALCDARMNKIDLRRRNQARSRRLFEIIKHLDFNGVSGHVKFLPSGTRDASTLTYQLENNIILSVNGSLEFVNRVVGTWDFPNRTWVLDESKIFYYPGDTQFAPQYADSIQVNENRILSEAKIVVFALAAFVYIVVAFAMILISVYHSFPLVPSAQKALFTMVLVGISVSTASVFFLSDDFYYQYQFRYSCQIAVSLWSLGVTLAASALILNCYRTLKLRNNSKIHEDVIHTHYLVICTTIVVLDIVILSTWAVIAPLHTVVKVVSTDLFGRPSSTYATCMGSRGDTVLHFVFIFVLTSFHLVLYVSVGIHAYRNRLRDGDFQEAKWIIVAICLQIQTILVAIPLSLAIQSNDTTSRFLLLSLVVLLTSSTFVAVVFMPRAIQFVSKNKA